MRERLTPADLEAIRARAEAAAPGPMRVEESTRARGDRALARGEGDAMTREECERLYAEWTGNGAEERDALAWAALVRSALDGWAAARDAALEEAAVRLESRATSEQITAEQRAQEDGEHAPVVVRRIAIAMVLRAEAARVRALKAAQAECPTCDGYGRIMPAHAVSIDCPLTACEHCGGAGRVAR